MAGQTIHGITSAKACQRKCIAAAGWVKQCQGTGQKKRTTMWEKEQPENHFILPQCEPRWRAALTSLRT